MEKTHTAWLQAARQSADLYRLMIDRTVRQLTDEELNQKPSDSLNSVAVLLRHLGGNLESRWTDFLTTDGEKDWRNRDQEFQDWMGDRDSLLAYFAAGWNRLQDALAQAETLDPTTELQIRGETHTLADALMRSLTHVSYHVGQIAMVGRSVHDGDWQWLTIEPGASDQFNKQTWGTAKSRAVSNRADTS